MSNIYGILERESRAVTLGDNKELDCEIRVGSVKDSNSFVDVIVTNVSKDFKATIKVHGKEVAFMLCAEKNDDIAIVKSMVVELKNWLISCDYNEMFIVLEDLKELEATLSTYLEDIHRMEE